MGGGGPCSGSGRAYLGFVDPQFLWGGRFLEA